ncbi:hypothetical protein E2C01_032986 [Portunus trituberculatus]|uniref:Uncharacterized protein n=1 Tax=Portunus trituberculatus TaxID=210409 RepID=A0A5B7F2J5_PORTR|nr:hypothetical protein [Portunus trituberculatus]
MSGKEIQGSPKVSASDVPAWRHVGPHGKRHASGMHASQWARRGKREQDMTLRRSRNLKD